MKTISHSPNSNRRSITSIWLALALVAVGLGLGGCAAGVGTGGVYASTYYPDYTPYYGYYGYGGEPYGYPGGYSTGIVLSSGRHYSRGYGHHHFSHDFHRGGSSHHSGRDSHHGRVFRR